MKNTRVLHMLNSLNYGGAERFLLNLLKEINSRSVKFDVITRNSTNPMENEFEKYGAKIIVSPDFPKNILKHYQYMKFFLKNHAHEYDFIHIHANSLIYILPLNILKKIDKNTRPKIILHSHSSFSVNPLVTKIHNYNKKKYLKFVDYKVACSELAGDWMFNNQNYKLIYNGINIEGFYYNLNYRKSYREEFNIKDKDILLGSIGRLTKVKNFSFLIKVLKKLKEESDKSYKLIIIGKGELENKLKKLVLEYELQDSVIFTGQRNDVNKILSAMDVYLQPSLFEGFPFTVIEAQTSNLPVILSDVITQEVKISKKTEFLNNDDVNIWYDKILQLSSLDMNRFDYSEINTEIIDMQKIAEIFEKMYSV